MSPILFAKASACAKSSKINSREMDLPSGETFHSGVSGASFATSSGVSAGTPPSHGMHLFSLREVILVVKGHIDNVGKKIRKRDADSRERFRHQGLCGHA